ncbi:TolC family protein [Dehalobacter sp. TBBPA1]|uniref:TolC family protein n=1 Tax=Dehalobacter sp. TBBPA1 TaxID=3235037 RepID=UPI0034A5CB1C
MKKLAIHVLILLCISLLMMPQYLFADDWEADPNTIYKIDFEQIKTLMIERNLTILSTNDSYYALASAGVDIGTAGINAEMANMLLIYQKDAEYIAYNTIQKQIEVQAQQLVIAEKGYILAKKQLELGMTTETEVAKAQNELNNTMMQLRNLQDTQKKTLKSFNMAIDQDCDAPLVLGTVPVVKEENISKIKVDEDYEKAKVLSYKIQVATDNYQVTDAERNFENGFYQTYQNILEKQKQLKLEQDKMTVAENKWLYTQYKANLGMISNIQLETEKLSYMSQTLSLVSAQNALFSAYNDYQWAKEGLVVSSSSSAS